jgi:hypothetical protein
MDTCTAGSAGANSSMARKNSPSPAVLVIHENRGLNPYIEDLARRLAVADFIAFAPDALTSLAQFLSLFRRQLDPLTRHNQLPNWHANDSIRTASL